MGNALGEPLEDDDSEAAEDEEELEMEKAEMYASVMAHMLRQEASRQRSRARAKERAQGKKAELARRAAAVAALVRRPSVAVRRSCGTCARGEDLAPCAASSASRGGHHHHHHPRGVVGPPGLLAEVMVEVALWLSPRERLEMASSTCTTWLHAVRGAPAAWPALRFVVRSRLDGPSLHRIAHVVRLDACRTLRVDDRASRSEGLAAATWKAFFEAFPRDTLRSLTIATRAPFKVHATKAVVARAGEVRHLGFAAEERDAAKTLPTLLGGLPKLRSLALLGSSSYVPLAGIASWLHPDACVEAFAATAQPTPPYHTHGVRYFFRNTDTALASLGAAAATTTTTTTTTPAGAAASGGPAGGRRRLAPNDGAAAAAAPAARPIPTGGGGGGDRTPTAAGAPPGHRRRPPTPPRDDAIGIAEAFPRLAELALRTSATELLQPAHGTTMPAGTPGVLQPPQQHIPHLARLRSLTVSIAVREHGEELASPVRMSATALARACPQLETLAARVGSRDYVDVWEDTYAAFVRALELSPSGASSSSYAPHGVVRPQLPRLRSLTLFDVEPIWFGARRTTRRGAVTTCDDDGADTARRRHLFCAGDIRAVLEDTGLLQAPSLVEVHLAFATILRQGQRDTLAKLGLVQRGGPDDALTLAEHSRRVVADLDRDKAAFRNGRLATIRLSQVAGPVTPAYDLAERRDLLRYNGTPNFGGVVRL